MPSSKKLGSNDEQIIKSLTADNARRQAAMKTAAKAGIKLSGSRYSGDGPPQFTNKEIGAISRTAKARQKMVTGPRSPKGPNTGMKGLGPNGPKKPKGKKK